MVIPQRFPPEEGKKLISIIGLRTQESMNRRLGISSSKGFLTKGNQYGVLYARPIYDWSDGDVWKAHKDYGWEYNEAYNVMYRLGLAKNQLRIAPPTMSLAGLTSLQLAAKAWPQWFDALCERLPGVRSAALFGKRAIEPFRKSGESWEKTFQRQNIDEAPPWIQERAMHARDILLHKHKSHSSNAFPQNSGCKRCGLTGSWKALTKALYMGDPFSLKLQMPYVEPDYFRPGAGKWGGKPQW